LKYFDGEPVIREIERVSKPGRRVYASVKNLPRINNGLGISVLSTPKGIMADHDAREANVGGEILFKVFWSRSKEVQVRKKDRHGPERRHRKRGRTDGQGEGPERPASGRDSRRRFGCARQGRGQGRAALRDQALEVAVRHLARVDRESRRGRHQGVREE